LLGACLALSTARGAAAQQLSQRGFIEAAGFGFPETAPNDQVQVVGDVLFREEAFWKPARWFELDGGIDARANSHGQVEDQWRIDWDDRGIERPRLAVRRLSTTLTAGGFSLTVGKQFVRWARADILNPADRFAPRDYMNVIDPELLPIFAVRPALQMGPDTFDVVWSPHFTPARLALIHQRWTVLPPEAAGLTIVDAGSVLPNGSEQGIRWNHIGRRFETALSYFDGYNYLPDIDVQPIAASVVRLTRVFPKLHTFGADLAIPTPWVTLKSEAAYFKSPSGGHNEYVLYVVELERQRGEWVFDGGYIGEAVTRSVAGSPPRFAPDEGVAKSIIARASYTVDPRRTVAIQGAVRQSGDGFYLQGEYSQAVGQHWRATLSIVGLGGQDADFLGQYHRNSYASFVLRFSF
jgi:hypothetical protein